MTTKTRTSSSKRPARRKPSTPKVPKVLVDALGPAAGAELYRYLRGAQHRDGRRVYPDLDQALGELIPPRFLSPPPSAATRKALGARFDLNEVDRFLRFTRKLRHIKGSKWAGRPLELDLWQVVYVVAPLFGWRRSNGTRLYRALYLEVPRKNGKSTLAAAIELYCLVADREPGAEVYAAAGDRKQARAMFDVAKAMVLSSPELSKRLDVLRDAIVYEARFSKFEVLSADADLKHGLNVHSVTLDELHVHKKRDLVDTLETGTGSRENPLVVTITTAGVDDPGSIYTEKNDYARKVAGGELDDPELLAVIFTIDDGDDPFAEESWRKANPGYGTSLRPDYIAGEARKAAASPARLNTFLRLHLNVKTGQVTRWIPLDVFDGAGARWLTVDEDELEGRKAYGGLDLSSSVDLTAAVFVVPTLERMALDPDNPDELEEVEVLDVLVRAWTPAATLADRAVRDRAPYAQWVADGLLLTSPGEVISYDDVELELFALADRLDVRRVSFDRWGSKQLVGHLEDGGLNVFAMGQGFVDMTAPMKELERLLYQRRIRTTNPLLRWALGGLAVKQDAAGNLKPDRERSTARIDPLVALVMAIGAWMRAGEEKPEPSRAVVSW